MQTGVNSRAAKREQTRENILEAARQCFCETGFDKTSTRMIAERAGVAGAWSWALVLIPMILAMVIEAVLVGSPPGDGLLGPWLPHFAAS